MAAKKSNLEKEKNCLIIAEAGVNHNGNLCTALKLVDAAIECGADAIKFQTYKTEDLVCKFKHYHYSMLKKLELKDSDFITIKEYCDKKHIIFLSTPHTEQSVDFLNDLVPIFKIGSGDLTNIPLLEKVAKTGKPIILGTGMSNINEIREAIEYIWQYNSNVTLLHCTTQYPCPKNKVNLNAMIALGLEFKTCKIGYSDHTEGIDVAHMAVELGATVIEKHFTLDKKMKGPDHKASLNPIELKRLITHIRLKKYPKLNKIILGNKVKQPTKEEIKISKLVRKSIVAAIDIPKNTLITRDMLTTKRPGTGLHPRYITVLLDSKTKNFIKKDTIIKMEDVQ